ncbi:MAG: hypothetical protein K0Q72_629 [Armatimonadetes bacterium]|jgi:hypothetical protein|nr:hypothetical protein [Armatimonadota bacterium]
MGGDEWEGKDSRCDSLETRAVLARAKPYRSCESIGDVRSARATPPTEGAAQAASPDIELRDRGSARVRPIGLLSEAPEYGASQFLGANNL